MTKVDFLARFRDETRALGETSVSLAGSRPDVDAKAAPFSMARWQNLLRLRSTGFLPTLFLGRAKADLPQIDLSPNNAVLQWVDSPDPNA